MLIRHDFRFDLNGKNTQFLLGNQTAVRLQQAGSSSASCTAGPLMKYQSLPSNGIFFSNARLLAGEGLLLAITIDGTFIHDIAGFPTLVGFDFCE